MEIKLYTVKEVAGILGITPLHTRRLCKKGIIKGQKVGRDWIITDHSGYPRKKRK